MDNKFNNMLKEFMKKNGDIKNLDDANKKLQEFITMYNNGEIEYENTPLDDAYDLLEKASSAKSKKQALKYAKEAYKVSSECFDAILFQVDLEEDYSKKLILLNEGLKKEEDRLRKEGYFAKENIGHFYGIFETRPYIRGLNAKAMIYYGTGRLGLSKDIFEEIIRLNKNDNIGCRYVLINIYTRLEDEKNVLKLYKKYSEDTFTMLFTLFVFYYKLGDDKKACEYLRRAYNANKNLVKFFKDELDINDNKIEDYYSMGAPSEIFMYFYSFGEYVMDMLGIGDYIISNLKK